MNSEPGGEGNKVSDKPHRKRKGSEGVASPDVLKLLGHLRWGSVQFLRDILLFVGLHGVELLTEISINHILRHEKMRGRKRLDAQRKWHMLKHQLQGKHFILPQKPELHLQSQEYYSKLTLSSQSSD